MNGITSKPLLVDQLKPELGAKISKFIADDTARAQARKKAKAAKGERKRDDAEAAERADANATERADG